MSSRDELGPRRVAGVAALGYVAGASIENMELLDAPTLGSPVADVRAAYADQALAAVTWAAGALALVLYVVFVVALVALLRGRERRGEPWPTVALVGGVGGAALAFAGVAAAAVLVAGPADGLSNDSVAALSDVHLGTRTVAGTFVALFLLGAGVAALRTGALPRPLAWLACAIAAPLALAPLAAVTAAEPLEAAIRVAFGLQALWIFATGVWLLLADGVSPVTFVRHAAFLLLMIAAGLIGIALLAVPGATGEFFSWRLSPAPLAAYAGGVYVGSAVVYAVALPRGCREVRGLVVGAVVLSVSVLVITLTHLDPFDFGRLQTWAWIALFAGFSLVTATLVVLGPGEPAGADAPRLAPWARVLFALVAAPLAALAVALWIDPGALAGPGAFELPPLGGRFAGAWIALLAVLAGWAALRDRGDEAWLSALALVALPAGALVAALRTLPDLEPAGAAAGYLAGVVLLLGCGLLLLLTLREGGAGVRGAAPP